MIFYKRMNQDIIFNSNKIDNLNNNCRKKSKILKI